MLYMAFISTVVSRTHPLVTQANECWTPQFKLFWLAAHRASPAALCWFSPQSWPKPHGLLLGGSENSYSTGVMDLSFLFCFCPRFHPNYLSWYLGKHHSPFHKKFRNVYVQWAMSLATAQNDEQIKTNVVKYDRGATLLIGKVLMKLSNWEKHNVGHAKKWGQKPCVGQSQELKETEHGVTSEDLSASVLVFLPFSLGSKEPSSN